MLIIDGSYYLHVFNHSLKPLRKTKHNVGGIYGLSRLLLSIEGYKYICVVFDDGACSQRKKMFLDYKAHRVHDPEIFWQKEEMYKILRTAEICCLHNKNVEGDDTIASVTRALLHKVDKVEIWSRDKDLLQITGALVTNRGYPFNSLPVPNHRVQEYLSLLGDQADNIPGVKGIGSVGATKIIETLGEDQRIDNAFIDNLPGKYGDLLRAGRESFWLSYRLVQLIDTIEVPQDLASYRVPAKLNINLDEYIGFL